MHSNCVRCHNQAKAGDLPIPDYDAGLIDYGNFDRFLVFGRFPFGSALPHSDKLLA
jgi:hypothetical protein